VQFFQKLLGKELKSKGIIALSISTEGIALAISEYNENQKPTLVHCEFIHTNNKLATLKELTEKHQLEKYECNLVLTSNDYRLVTIEAPSVEDDELSDAIRWKISDLIEFQVDDAIIEHYPLPASQRSNNESMLEIIACPRSAVQTLVDLCINCGLQLKVIDTQETTLRNLATLLPENNLGIATLHLQKNSGRIIIERQGSIYLSRRFTKGFDQLGLADNFLSTEQIAMEQSNLALEIQRSFDYVESFYGLPPISCLAVIPLTENTQGLLNFLNSNHGITARIMDLSTIIDGDILLDDKTQSLCAPVIGATLRNSIESL